MFENTSLPNQTLVYPDTWIGAKAPFEPESESFWWSVEHLYHDSSYQQERSNSIRCPHVLSTLNSSAPCFHTEKDKRRRMTPPISQQHKNGSAGRLTIRKDVFFAISLVTRPGTRRADHPFDFAHVEGHGNSSITTKLGHGLLCGNRFASLHLSPSPLDDVGRGNITLPTVTPRLLLPTSRSFLRYASIFWYHHLNYTLPTEDSIPSRCEVHAIDKLFDLCLGPEPMGTLSDDMIHVARIQNGISH